jgi:hypothetical protein
MDAKVASLRSEPPFSAMEECVVQESLPSYDTESTIAEKTIAVEFNWAWKRVGKAAASRKRRRRGAPVTVTFDVKTTTTRTSSPVWNSFVEASGYWKAMLATAVTALPARESCLGDSESREFVRAAKGGGRFCAAQALSGPVLTMAQEEEEEEEEEEVRRANWSA